MGGGESFPHSTPHDVFLRRKSRGFCLRYLRSPSVIHRHGRCLIPFNFWFTVCFELIHEARLLLPPPSGIVMSWLWCLFSHLRKPPPEIEMKNAIHKCLLPTWHPPVSWSPKWVSGWFFFMNRFLEAFRPLIWRVSLSMVFDRSNVVSRSFKFLFYSIIFEAFLVGTKLFSAFFFLQQDNFHCENTIPKRLNNFLYFGKIFFSHQFPPWSLTFFFAFLVSWTFVFSPLVTSHKRYFELFRIKSCIFLVWFHVLFSGIFIPFDFGNHDFCFIIFMPTVETTKFFKGGPPGRGCLTGFFEWVTGFGPHSPLVGETRAKSGGGGQNEEKWPAPKGCKFCRPFLFFKKT